jgi:hypothetical protein
MLAVFTTKEYIERFIRGQSVIYCLFIVSSDMVTLSHRNSPAAGYPVTSAVSKDTIKETLVMPYFEKTEKTCVIAF